MDLRRLGLRVSGTPQTFLQQVFRYLTAEKGVEIVERPKPMASRVRTVALPIWGSMKMFHVREGRVAARLGDKAVEAGCGDVATFDGSSRALHRQGRRAPC
jgi:hypothetical protein